MLLIRQTKWFLMPLGLILYFTLGVLVSAPKAQIHIWFNQFHTTTADVFFKYYTNVGDGLFIIAIALIIAYRSYKKGLIVLLSYAISGILAQIVKHLVFSNNLRPYLYFKDNYELYLVEGVKMYSHNSFPSGHTTAAFAMFLALSLFSANKYIQVLYLLAAVLVAWSRIYLSQHFLVDTFAGAIIGVIVTYFIYIWINSINNKWINKGIFAKVKN